MIPIKLTLRGFYSYRSTQTIHFDKLTEAHIFGIFGSTGSGKSTIPEAISFALYGDTERLNQKEGRGYNMMNLKSDELFIDFIFMAGMIPQKYRATATAKRNSRNFNDVKTIERKAWQWNGVDWEPIEPSTIEGIIGLSYSNFKRTTIIPQGKFQEFLQLGDTERVKMMQELFGLEKFDLQFKTASVLKKSNETRIRLQTQVNELQGIDEAALNELNEQINAKTAVVEEVTRKLSDAQTREKDLLQHLETFKQHAEARKALDAILEKTFEIASLESRVNEFLYCQTHFQPLLLKRNELAKQHTELIAQLAKQLSKEAQLTSQINAEQSEISQLEPLIAAIPSDLEKAKQLRTASQWITANKQITEMAERNAKGQEYIQNAEAQLNTLKLQRKQKQDLLEVNQAAMPNVQHLEQIQQWWMQQDHLEAKVGDAKKVCSELEEKQKTILDAVTQNKTIAQLIDYHTYIQPSEALHRIETKMESQRAALELLENELQPLIISVKLADFASDLAPGEPCPLCGSTQHPHKYDPPQARERIAELNLQKKLLLQSQTELEKWREFCKQASSDLQIHQKLLATANQKMELIAEEYQNHLNTYASITKLPLERKALSEAQNQLNELRTEIDTLRKQLDATLKEQDKVQGLLDKARIKMNGITGELEQQKGIAIALAQQIPHESLVEAEQKGEDWAKNKAAALEEAAEDSNAKYHQLKTSFDTKHQELAREQGQLSSLAEHAEQVHQQLSATNTALNVALQSSTFESIEQITNILSIRFDTMEALERVNTWKFEKERLHELVAKLAQNVAEHPFDETAFKDLGAQIKQYETQKALNTGELAVLKQGRTDVMQKLERLKVLQADLETVENRLERLEVLKNLFQAKGFVNYVSSVYMQNLVNAANERFFKLTGHKLRLELTAKNDFEVRDFMNNGQTRHVKTLSGGQTFQASLSLALALADSIHYQRQTKENFFFLDEGFGSLDRESLQMVFETLKALRAENRIVGIISHVEELQHEIDAYVQITNTPEQGSVVVSSVGG